MKIRKLFLVLLLLFISSGLYSQFYIGWTQEKVISFNKTQNDLGPIEKSKLSNGVTALAWNNNKMYYRESVFFDDNGKVVSYTILPSNMEIFKGLVKVYDEQAIKVSSTLWRYYLYGKTYRVSADYVEETNSYYFYITLWD